jgi:hypothetical protein
MAEFMSTLGVGLLHCGRISMLHFGRPALRRNVCPDTIGYRRNMQHDVLI